MTMGEGRTYRFLKNKEGEGETTTQIFGFGYGLSYTQFAFADVKVSWSSSDSNRLAVSLVVENIGFYDGAEVIQIYAGYDRDFVGYTNESLVISLSIPRIQLVAFSKVEVARGMSVAVKFELVVPDCLVAFGRWISPELLSGRREIAPSSIPVWFSVGNQQPSKGSRASGAITVQEVQVPFHAASPSGLDGHSSLELVKPHGGGRLVEERKPETLIVE